MSLARLSILAIPVNLVLPTLLGVPTVTLALAAMVI
jgi:hypothetical protein